jgi:hypothetical protein
MTSDNLEVVKSDLKKIVKRPYRIGDKIIIVLEESIMEKFKFDDQNIWFEQIALENGILLKIMKCFI